MTKQDYTTQLGEIWKPYHDFNEEYKTQRDSLYVEMGRMFYKIRHEKKCKSFFEIQKNAERKLLQLKTKRGNMYHEAMFQQKKLKEIYNHEKGNSNNDAADGGVSVGE